MLVIDYIFTGELPWIFTEIEDTEETLRQQACIEDAPVHDAARQRQVEKSKAGRRSLLSDSEDETEDNPSQQQFTRKVHADDAARQRHATTRKAGRIR